MSKAIHTGCPNCRRGPLQEDDQPFPENHAYSILYECGSQIVYVIAGDYWEWQKECTKELDASGK